MMIAATGAFATHGYAGVSMEVIAAECQITKPMLYRYFGSKEGLYLACLERSGVDLVASVSAAAADANTPRERIRDGFLAFLDFVRAQQVGWNMLFDDTAAIPASIRLSIADLRAELAGMLETVLGEPDPQLRSARAHALIGAGEALVNWWLVHPEQPPEALAEVFVSMWDG